jgi:A/G-specific adenine glycosylase
MAKKDIFASRLLEWGKLNVVDFPWRKTTDPFKILISEIMLRKTTRKQVSQIYDDFFRRYPDVRSLAEATVESIEDTIRPLGMEHIRAVALKKAAEKILSKFKGKIPSERNLLMELPHVGRYTANAVLCFGFGMDAPLLDTNVIRVVNRVFSIRTSRKRARDDPKMWKVVSSLIPKGRAGDFNRAVLDFAASICVAKNPKCSLCPMLDICDYAISRM